MLFPSLIITRIGDIADITDGEDRARHFGLMSACFGVGMVAGPLYQKPDINASGETQRAGRG